jgi:hypothetical protein
MLSNYLIFLTIFATSFAPPAPLPKAQFGMFNPMMDPKFFDMGAMKDFMKW